MTEQPFRPMDRWCRYQVLTIAGLFQQWIQQILILLHRRLIALEYTYHNVHVLNRPL